MKERALRASVRGRVQGVGYRFFVVREAERLGVRGYARNLPDGTVEVLATGDDAALEKLVARLREGPRGARVERVECADVQPVPDLAGFEIRG